MHHELENRFLHPNAEILTRPPQTLLLNS